MYDANIIRTLIRIQTLTTTATATATATASSTSTRTSRRLEASSIALERRTEDDDEDEDEHEEEAVTREGGAQTTMSVSKNSKGEEGLKEHLTERLELSTVLYLLCYRYYYYLLCFI